MKRIAFILGLLGVFMMIVGMPSAFAGSTTHYDSGWVSIVGDFFADCAGESISYTGISHQQYTETVDTYGGYHFELQQTTRGTAVGSISGNGYRFKDDFACVTNIPISEVNQFACPINGRFISLDKDKPDVFYKARLAWTYDANGNLRALIFVEDVTCR